VGAKEACAWGWASGEPTADVITAAKDLIQQHLDGKVKLAPVNPEPMEVPSELPKVDLGHHSIAVDTILVDVVRNGLAKTLPDGLHVEASGFARCKEVIDYNIGMTNFIVNGPRVPAAFMHE
jgi:enoyl-CoA hydratase/3-hydroxyacyl-CoA dehydrogenase